MSYVTDADAYGDPEQKQTYQRQLFVEWLGNNGPAALKDQDKRRVLRGLCHALYDDGERLPEDLATSLNHAFGPHSKQLYTFGDAARKFSNELAMTNEM